MWWKVALGALVVGGALLTDDTRRVIGRQVARGARFVTEHVKRWPLPVHAHPNSQSKKEKPCC
jgi:hypothetical protein